MYYTIAIVCASIGLASCGDSEPSVIDGAVAIDGARGADGSVVIDARMATDAVAPVDSAPSTDAGPLGGTSSGSLQIQAVLRGPVGKVDLPLVDVVVTYVKPDGTGDLAGFFVQSEQIGPALFVLADAVSPAALPSVGDRVSFRVLAHPGQPRSTASSRRPLAWTSSRCGRT